MRGSSPEATYPKLLDVCKCGKATQESESAQLFREKGRKLLADPESLDGGQASHVFMIL
jgi:hypothetical protein